MLKDRFSRWQTKTNTQFGYLNNLLLVLSVGTLGFVINQLTQETFIIENCWAKVFFGLGVIFLLISVITGTYLGYNRLIDFRKTAKLILSRIEKNEDELAILKQQTEYLGKASWVMLRIQFFSFILAEFLIGFSFLMIFGDKLF
jgi:uncharacterized membrane protein YhaH (DUF805 family)